jgi:hypothetical protein
MTASAGTRRADFSRQAFDFTSGSHESWDDCFHPAPIVAETVMERAESPDGRRRSRQRPDLPDCPDQTRMGAAADDCFAQTDLAELAIELATKRNFATERR